MQNVCWIAKIIADTAENQPKVVKNVKDIWQVRKICQVRPQARVVTGLAEPPVPQDVRETNHYSLARIPEWY